MLTPVLANTLQMPSTDKAVYILSSVKQVKLKFRLHLLQLPLSPTFIQTAACVQGRVSGSQQPFKTCLLARVNVTPPLSKPSQAVTQYLILCMHKALGIPSAHSNQGVSQHPAHLVTPQDTSAALHFIENEQNFIPYFPLEDTCSEAPVSITGCPPQLNGSTVYVIWVK